MLLFHWKKQKDHFNRYHLLDDNVIFVKGYFNDTMPTFRTKDIKISILRIDGDMFILYMDVLFNLYEKIPVGGYVIIDDYAIGSTKKVVD